MKIRKILLVLLLLPILICGCSKENNDKTEENKG